MKDIVYSFLLLIIGAIFGVVIYATIQTHSTNYHMTTVNPIQTEYIYIERPVDVPEVEETFYLELTDEECDLLEQIAMAEAGNQDTKGKALIMRVVLNRVEKNGTDIKTEIYKPNQFYTAGMREGDEECHEALAMILENWDESDGAIYFCSTGWNKYGQTHLFKYGSHYFSK